MAFVETILGGRTYRIDCAEAQYERLKRLTSVVEARAAALEESGAASVAPVGEDPELRFLLLTSLLVADQLIKAEEEIETLREERGAPDQPLIRAAESETIEEAEIVPAEETGAADDGEAEEWAATEAEAAEPGPRLDPEIEVALASLFESAAERMNAAAEALDRV